MSGAAAAAAPSATTEEPAPTEEVTGPRPLQIIEIHTETNTFSLKTELLQHVLDQVPRDLKVAIVSVVGTFRTGKSFLLDCFLKYLRLPQDRAAEMGWDQLFADGDYLEGNINNGSGGNAEAPSDGFSWRAGRDTNTMGIWIWSQPFLRKLPKTGEEVAVLVMDTQGMFDRHLSTLLTTSIFGLSTLLSSYQVYNVVGQIDESNLQHLSLFAEYARSPIQQEATPDGAAGETKGSGDEDGDNAGSSALQAQARPFQTLQFLVRDWREFEDLEEEDLDNIAKLEADMNTYLSDILAEDNNEDIKSVRKHIQSCFEKCDSYLLPHPGLGIVKKSYDGNMAALRPVFRRLMRRYVHAIFEERLEAKRIHNSFVTASELLEYAKAYTSAFKGNKFPECKTLLNAVADANNRNALEKAYRTFKREMDDLCGIGKKYVDPAEITSHFNACVDAAVQQFAAKATYGPATEIQRYRDMLEEQCRDRFDEMMSMNAERDPFKNLVVYAPAITVAVGAYVVRFVSDLTCFTPETAEFDWEYRDICKRFGSFMGDVYAPIFFFLFIGLAVKGHGTIARLRALFAVVSNVGEKDKVD